MSTLQMKFPLYLSVSYTTNGLVSSDPVLAEWMFE